MKYEILFDSDFNEYEWEVEAKGCLEQRVKRDGQVIMLSFYDAFRLTQEVTDALAKHGMFAETHIVVVPKVTRSEIEKAVARLETSGVLQNLQGSTVGRTDVRPK